MSLVTELERYVRTAISSRQDLTEAWLRECVRNIQLANVHMSIEDIMKESVLERVEDEEAWFFKWRGQRVAKMTLPKARRNTKREAG